jgi:TctA family transporter
LIEKILMCVFGLSVYFLVPVEFSVAPLLLGLILRPIAEANVTQASVGHWIELEARNQHITATDVIAAVGVTVAHISFTQELANTFLFL